MTPRATPRLRCSTTLAAIAILVLALGAYRTLTGAAGRGPDLIVSSIVVKDDKAGVYTISARIVNQGTNRAVPSFAGLSIDVGGQDRWDVKATGQRVGALSPGSSADITWSNAGPAHVFAWRALPGKARVQICADVDDGVTTAQVQETNETNNCKTVAFTVR